jgi:hypothetical protein
MLSQRYHSYTEWLLETAETTTSTPRWSSVSVSRVLPASDVPFGRLVYIVFVLGTALSIYAKYLESVEKRRAAVR